MKIQYIKYGKEGSFIIEWPSNEILSILPQFMKLAIQKWFTNIEKYFTYKLW